MRPFPRASLPLAAAIAFILSSAGAAGLDHTRIHFLYNEGDFDKVIVEINAFTNRNKTYPREDSVFIAKHLAVVYSADPNNQEKGMYYMHHLLALVPTADLADMYVSSEIYRIFERVQKEFAARSRAFGVESPPVSLPPRQKQPDAPATPPKIAAAEKPAPRAAPEPAPSVPLWKRKAFWVATGTGIVTVSAGVAAYFAFKPERKVRENPAF